LPTRSLRRLLVTVFFIFVIEGVPFFLIPSKWLGWLGLASGIVGSIVLLFPPLRLEFMKGAKSAIKQSNPQSQVLKDLGARLDVYFTRKIEEVDPLDMFWLIIGGFLLMFYFLYQIPGKLELANLERTIQAKIDQFKTREISPLQDRLRDLEDR
jgi:hypothetical protein